MTTFDYTLALVIALVLIFGPLALVAWLCERRKVMAVYLPEPDTIRDRNARGLARYLQQRALRERYAPIHEGETT